MTYLFVVYVTFNSQGDIVTGSLWVEETSAYCTVNHRASASNYQLSNLKGPARDSNRRPQRLEARTLTATPLSPPLVGDTADILSSDSEQGYSDPDFIGSSFSDIDPDLVLEYRKWKAQIGTKFGCVPLAPIYVSKGAHKVWHSIPDLLMAHRLIKSMCIPNFLGLHIPVNTHLNVSSWRKHLADYFDQQLTDLIKFGFALDFDTTRNLQSTLVNHASARLYPV